MRKAARDLAFEKAAEARDLIIELRKEIISRQRHGRKSERGLQDAAAAVELLEPILVDEGGAKSEPWPGSRQDKRKKRSASPPGTKSSSGGRASTT